MSAIECKIISAPLMSGSDDSFRTAVGGYWEEVESDDNTSVEFVETSATSPDYEYFSKIYLSDESSHTDIQHEVYTLNKKAPVRVVGNTIDVKNDDHWKAIWLGGILGEVSYSGIYSENTFQYVNFGHSRPYTQLSASALAGGYASEVIQISYDYRNHLRYYENYITNEGTPELLLPNFYLMADMSRWDATTTTASYDLYPADMLTFMSREGNANFEITQFFDYNASKLPFVPLDAAFESSEALRNKNNNLAIDYLTSSVVQFPLSGSSISWAEKKLKTMLFDNKAIEELGDFIDPTTGLQTMLPYNMKVTFPVSASGDFVQSVIESEFDSEFIKMLYQAFDDRSGAVVPHTYQYTRESTYYSGSSTGIDTEVVKTAGVGYREVDYMQMLLNAHNAYKTTDDEFMFVGPRTLQRYAAESTVDAYRYVNSAGASAAIAHAYDYMRDNPSNTKVTDWEDLFSNKETYNETVAYRVQKIGGAGTGDSNTQNVIQTFWFLNAPSMKDFLLIDSQVKYGVPYTYKVHAYVLVQGIRYSFSDLLLSRQIGCESENGETGLEFYDPASGTRSERIFKDPNAAFNTTLTGSNTFTTDAHIFSAYPYAADFHLNYEPAIKIVEIPLYNKALRILDNPPNVLNITPFQTAGTKSTLGFDMIYNASADKPFPTSITEDDEEYKLNYLHANDLTINDNVVKTTTSSPRTMEIYRLPERPRSISEFSSALRSTVDLKVLESNTVTYQNADYHDKVAPNRKYYYLFRVLNEHRTQSYLSPVYEGQLIDDGGYSYAIFNIIMESELEEKIFNNPTKSFRNLIQLQPNLSQTGLNTIEADFRNSAASEMSNVTIGSANDLIWDKTFKIRLTSKKTGKKIDLNITYNLNSE